VENLNIQKQFYHITNKMAELKTEVSVGGGCELHMNTNEIQMHIQKKDYNHQYLNYKHRFEELKQ
jgi:hypothetical protein